MISSKLKKIKSTSMEVLGEHNRRLSDFIMYNPDSSILNSKMLYDRMIDYGVDESTVAFAQLTNSLEPDDFLELNGRINDRQNINMENIPELIPLKQGYIGPNGKGYLPLPKYIPNHIKPNLDNLIKSGDAMLKKITEINGYHNRRLIIESGFRSAAYQGHIVIPRMLYRHGPEKAFDFVNLHGFSQHSNPIETAFDFTLLGDKSGNILINGTKKDAISMLLSPEFIALLKLGPMNGFWLPYYPDVNDIDSNKSPNGLDIETWHWQYVGTDKAQRLMDENGVYEALDLFYRSIDSNITKGAIIDFTKRGVDNMRESLMS